ncbi:MAG: cryptochrome/photolyase family protein [Campylobacterales bacterium]|nr:cryptochrome/photolyase family protein [Campylobacterales bacterium]
MNAFLVFPHQLFKDVTPLKDYKVYLVEEPLFFTQYRFHVQKLMLHRASMKWYADYLASQEIESEYVDVDRYEEVMGSLDGISCYDVADFDLMTSLKQRFSSVITFSSPNFFNTHDDTRFMHYFYINRRKEMKILIDQGKPIGGKWSLDSENRKKLPLSLTLPQWQSYENAYIVEARAYVSCFDTFGESEPFYYPVDFAEAEALLDEFLAHRFANFGDYQDAMTLKDSPLFHSMVSSALNIGLLDPEEIVKRALETPVPLNAKEGFVRQIIGWREFMRRTYDTIGVQQRTTNYFGFTKSIPAKVLEGKSGLLPLDDVIQKVKKRGYAHHIERLMVLGNYLLLTECHPDSVYQFFMSGFIDAYDWVMVGNVYGMSQYADGGLITTKPYVSGSNYLLKMSDYPKGEWCKIWDALYWRFIYVHQEQFKNNPRMHFALQGLERIKEDTLNAHLERAVAYLHWLER